jgi:hypothetical protein
MSCSLIWEEVLSVRTDRCVKMVLHGLSGRIVGGLGTVICISRSCDAAGVF